MDASRRAGSRVASLDCYIVIHPCTCIIHPVYASCSLYIKLCRLYMYCKLLICMRLSRRAGSRVASLDCYIVIHPCQCIIHPEYVLYNLDMGYKDCTCIDVYVFEQACRQPGGPSRMRSSPRKRSAPPPTVERLQGYLALKKHPPP